MDFKYLLKIFIIIFLILSVIIFLNTIGLNLNEPEQHKELVKVITVEGMNPLTTSSSKAFCDTNKGYNLEIACNKLTKYNCGLTSCCIWTSDNKCKAGNKDGPLFGSDSKGKTIPLDYYFFQNNCYGENCSNN